MSDVVKEVDSMWTVLVDETTDRAKTEQLAVLQ